MSWEHFIQQREAGGRARRSRRQARAESGVEALLKGLAQKRGKAGKSGEPKSYALDPYDPVGALVETGSDAHKGTFDELSYELLEALARTEFVSAVIGTRCHQVASFCEPSHDEHTPGFRVVLKDMEGRQNPSKKDQKTAAFLEQWLYTCGDEALHETPIDLPGMARQVLRDSLTYDQLCLEPLRNRQGLQAFVAVDAKTVRRAVLTAQELQNGRRDKERGYLQVINGTILQDFLERELVFAVRNPITDIRRNGYGSPELFICLRSVLGLLQSEDWNRSNFATGVQASGILAIISAMDDPEFNDFEEKFYSMLSGVDGAHRLPVVQLDPAEKEQIQHIDLSKANREMEYSAWNMWLMKKILMQFQMDPAELGYLFGNEGVSQSLNQQGPAERIAYSRERGLRPLLDFWGRVLQRFIDELDDRFVLEWTGLDVDNPGERLKARLDKTRTYMTINEARAEDGLEPIDEPWADLPDNAQVFQFVQSQMAMQQPQEQPQEEQAGQPADGEGAQGEDGDEGGDAEQGGFDFDIEKLFGRSALGQTAGGL